MPRPSPFQSLALPALGLAAAISAALLALGLAGDPAFRPTAIPAGALGLVLCSVGLALARLLGARSAPDPSKQLADLADAVRAMGEQAALSDDARRVLNRSRERALLRDAIEQDIHDQDWDAAIILVNELADRFGYRADAEEFRQRIERARFDTVQQHVREAAANIDALIVQRRWDQAHAQAARAARLFPDSSVVLGLRARIDHARALYKADLEHRFRDAAANDRVDDAMARLKELDAYLSEAEAAPFRETAREVIAKARDALGARFKAALQDRQWAAAADLGQRIIDEFPNSRMADEVRPLIEGLRARAAAPTR